MKVQYERYVEKTWGYEEWLKVTDKYAFKKLIVEKGKTLSEHYHKIKEETWYIAEGYGIAVINDEEIEIKKGDIIHLIPNTIHKVIAHKRLEIIEASTTELSDSIRVGEGK